MKQIQVILNVDEESILQESEQKDLDSAISQELGWLHDSGMSVDSWTYLDPEKEECKDAPAPQQIKMTELERVQSMDVIDFAIYINELQKKAVEDFENGFFPKGVFDNVTMLEREVTELSKPSVESQIATARAQKAQTENPKQGRGAPEKDR